MRRFIIHSPRIGEIDRTGPCKRGNDWSPLLFCPANKRFFVLECIACRPKVRDTPVLDNDAINSLRDRRLRRRWHRAVRSENPVWGPLSVKVKVKLCESEEQGWRGGIHLSTCVFGGKTRTKKKDSLINYVQDTRVRRKSLEKYAKRRFVMWSKGVRTKMALR